MARRRGNEANAHAEGTRAAALALGVVTADEYDALVRSEQMLGPRAP
jgi:hypothetical protein